MKVIPNQKDKAKKKRRIRLWRWPAFIFIIFCLLLLFLLIGTLLIIPTNKASQWFLRQLNQKLQADFSIVIEANSLKFDIWRGYFQAQDLIIRRIESRDKQHKKLEKRPTGISSEPFLYLKKISINLGLLGLFRKKLHFEEVLIDSPSLKLEALNSREKENNSFVSYPVKSPEKERPKKAWRLQINYFQLNGGRIDFSLEQWITQFIFQNVNIEINFDETKKEHRGLFSLEKGEVFSKNQLALLLISTQVDFRFNKREIFFDRVFLNGKGLSIKGNGRLVFEPNIIVDQIKFKGEVNLEEIPFFNGSPNNYLIVNSFLNQEIQAEIDSEIKNKNRLRIEKIKRGSLEENWSRKKITSKGRIDFSLNLISEEGGLKGEFQFTGQEIIFRVSEEKTRGKVVASGLSSKERKIKLAEIKKAKEGLALEQQELLLEKELPILLTLPFLQGEAKGAIKKEKIYLECFRLDLPGVQLSSFGFYDKQKYFEANIELDFKDIGQTFRDLGLKDFISNQVDLFKETIDMQRKEIISGELKIRGFFSGYWPAVQGELEFLGINLAGPFWEKGELNLKASIRDKKINFSQFDFLSPHWEFNLGGFLSFTSIEDNFRQGSDLRAKLKIKDIAKLSKFFFPNNLALEGAIALETRLSGNLKKPRINFKIEGEDLIIDSDSLGAFEIIGKINPPLIAFADFRLKKSQEALPIQGNFFYDLEKKDLLIKIDCPYQNLADFSWLQKIWPIQGWLSFSLEARGIKNQINLSYKLNGNNLQAKYFSFNNLESEGKAFFKIRKWQLDPVSISADLRPTGLTIYSIPIETPEPIKFELREETLFISGFKLKGESFEFNLEGSLGFEKEKGKLHLEAQLPLDFINRYLELEIREKISARGKIVINGAIRGSFRNWTPDINLELKDGYLSSSLLRVPIEKISLLAQLREEALKLEELNLHFGRGSIFIQAQIPLFFSKRRTDFFMKNSRFTNNKMENIERKLEEAEISLVFSQLNPFDFFEKAMAKLPIEYQRKIKEGEIGGEISGVIKFNFRPILSAWLSTFKAEGRIDPLKIKFDSLLLSNEKPIVFRVTPEILILEESAIRAENLELDFRGVVKNPLKFKLWEKERLTNNFSQGLQHERLTQVKIKHQSETQTQNSLETLIDFNLRASANLEILRIFLENVDLRGLVALNFNLSGSIDKVKTKVFGEIRGVSFKSLELPFRLSDTTGTFFFDGRKLDIQSCRGLANGAAWEIAGFLELGDSLSFRPGYKPTLNSGFIQIEAKEIPFELEGVGATQVSLKLNLEPRKIAAIQEKRWFLVGEMNFKKTVLLADIGPITRFARPRKPLPKRAVGPSLPSFFENLNLNLRLNLDEPILISNPFLRTEIHGAVTLNGLATQPSLLGRLVNRGEGELLWGERRYRLEKMQIDLTGVFPLEPRLEIVAKTELIHRFNKFEISLHLTGPVSDLNFTLSSTPKLSQEEIALILFTGRSPDKFRTQGLEALRDQLLLTMAIPAASQLGSAIKRLFGLEEVRLEPLGIADETDPGARLTMVKQISPAARVTGSIDITNSQRQTWVIDYRLTQGIMFQGLRFDNGSFGAGLQHSFSLAGEKVIGEEKITEEKTEGESRQLTKSSLKLSKAERIISRIEVDGDLAFPKELIRRQISQLRPDNQFTSSLLDQEIRNLESFYRRNGYLQVKIEARIEEEKWPKRKRAELEEGEIEKIFLALFIEVKAGPKIELNYQGCKISQDLKRRIEAIWARESSFERAAIRSTRLIENSLRGKGYFQASATYKLIDWSADNSAKEKNLLIEEKWSIKEQSSENLKEIEQVRCEFSIEKGPRYRIDKIKIVGATEGRDKKLLQEIKSWRTTEARGGWLLIINRQSGLEAIQNWYASQGYLEAKADIEIEVRRFEKRINIKLLIEEGRLSQVAEIIIEGNEFFSSQELKKILLLKPGQLYNPDLVLKERNRLLAFYRSHGFREAVVTSRIEAKDEGPDVRINFQIKEGLLHKVSQVDFINLKESRKKKLAEIFNLKPGETFSSEKIFEGQKALYDTGDFSLVQVTIEPLPERPGEEKVKVELSPEPALSVGYGLRYNNKEKTEFTAGADFRHFFGFGRHGLVHYLQNARERDFRFSFLDRNFFGLKIESLLSFYLTRRKESGFISEEVGSSWRYQIALPGEVFMSTVIRRSRIHTYEINPVGPWPFDITLSLTELSIQTVRDTRDDSIDPHRGSFFSSSLTYSPKKLKSELTYLSWFGQASFYQPLSSNLIWASNFRLGLATAFDQVMIPSRRFYAGGSYSIRGFKQDMVGPYDPYLKRPEGGEAVLVTNQELRWSIVGGLEVAFFYDVGNVFPEVSDLNLKKLRHGAGFGLRFRSPLGLLRFDVGFNLKPRPGESRHVFFFSLGPIF